MDPTKYRTVWVLVPIQVSITNEDNIVARVIHPSREECERMSEMREYKNRDEAIDVCERVGYLADCDRLVITHMPKG